MRLINACALQEEYKAQHGGKRLLLIDASVISVITNYIWVYVWV